MSPRPDRSLPPAYFERLYAADPDPWGFATSAYERAKYDATLRALPKKHYANVFEVGCSIGVLTARLAERCDRLLAVDVAEDALDRARGHCAALPGVRFERMRFPDDAPEDRFDLIVLSEVVYYWSAPDVGRAADLAVAALEPEGDMILVHYVRATDYPLAGDDAAERFIAAARGCRVTRAERNDDYRIDVLTRGA